MNGILRVRLGLHWGRLHPGRQDAGQRDQVPHRDLRQRQRPDRRPDQGRPARLPDRCLLRHAAGARGRAARHRVDGAGADRGEVRGHPGGRRRHDPAPGGQPVRDAGGDLQQPRPALPQCTPISKAEQRAAIPESRGSAAAFFRLDHGDAGKSEPGTVFRNTYSRLSQPFGLYVALWPNRSHSSASMA